MFALTKGFSPKIAELMIEWHHTSIVTGQTAFTHLPSRERAKFRKFFGLSMTPEEQHSLRLPYIRSNSLEINWMLDPKGNIVVAKRDGYKPRSVDPEFTGSRNMTFEEKRTAAHEKNMADFYIHLGLPVLPVQLWEKPSPNPVFGPRLYSVTPEFPNAGTGPTDEMLMNDESESLARVSVADEWCVNTDRHRKQILFDKEARGPQIPMVYIDQGLSNHFAPEKILYLLERGPVPLLGVRVCEPFSEKLKGRVREQIDCSPKVHNVMNNIQSLPDDFIIDKVRRWPNEYYAPENHTSVKYRLLKRRDNIRTLTRKGIGLT